MFLLHRRCLGQLQIFQLIRLVAQSVGDSLRIRTIPRWGFSYGISVTEGTRRRLVKILCEKIGFFSSYQTVGNSFLSLSRNSGHDNSHYES